MRILIVDDSKVMLKTIDHTLRHNGYDTLVANDGFEAIEIIEKEKIDLVISDIMMPNISGPTLLNLLKQFYFNSVPVIFMSTLNQGGAILNSLDLGKIDFIAKPINLKKLLLLLKKYSD